MFAIFLAQTCCLFDLKKHAAYLNAFRNLRYFFSLVAVDVPNKQLLAIQVVYGTARVIMHSTFASPKAKFALQTGTDGELYANIFA